MDLLGRGYAAEPEAESWSSTSSSSDSGATVSGGRTASSLDSWRAASAVYRKHSLFVPLE